MKYANTEKNSPFGDKMNPQILMLLCCNLFVKNQFNETFISVNTDKIIYNKKWSEKNDNKNDKKNDNKNFR